MSSKTTNTKHAILTATWRLMVETGGRGVRMGDIARAAGVSRQAVYLHFASRTELLVATTRFVDDERGIDERMRRTRDATTGVERLDAWIEFWGTYIPEIHAVATALRAVRDTDEAAAAAWNDRMNAVRTECRGAITALQQDGVLAREWTVDEATDILWTMLAVQNWEQLTAGCGWSTTEYVDRMQALARRTFVAS